MSLLKKTKIKHLGSIMKNNFNLNVLCLDIGTQLGFAYYSKEQDTLISGSYSLKKPKQHDGLRYLNMNLFVTGILDDNQDIKCISYESVYRHSSSRASHVYGGLESVIHTICYVRDIPYETYTPTQIKKFICGKGNASKQEVIEAVKAIGFNPKDDNEADALSLYLLTLHT